MKKFSYGILKNLALLLALGLICFNLIWSKPDQVTLIVGELLLGFLYLVFSIGEFLDQLSKVNQTYERFTYLPLSIVTFKLIKVGAFTIAATVLFLSKSNLIFLAALLVLVLAVDLLIFALRLARKTYYISLFANYILFVLEEEQKIYATHIKIVEYRYGNFYLEQKNGKMHLIETSRLEKKQQTMFIEKFVLWVVCNNLHFTNEAKEKLADIIAEAT